jgi:hypothetical protein
LDRVHQGLEVKPEADYKGVVFQIQGKQVNLMVDRF